MFKREYFHIPANLSHVLMHLILFGSHLMVSLSSFHIKYVYNLGHREILQFINRDTLVCSIRLGPALCGPFGEHSVYCAALNIMYNTDVVHKQHRRTTITRLGGILDIVR